MRLLVSEIQSWRPQVYPPNAGRAFLLNVHTPVTSKWLIIRIFRHGLPPVVAAAFSLSA